MRTVCAGAQMEWAGPVTRWAMMHLQIPDVGRRDVRPARAVLRLPDSGPVRHAAPARQPQAPWRATLALIEHQVPFVRRRLKGGAMVQHAGDAFEFLHLVHWGAVKTVGVTDDGYAQITGLHVKGDWVGFDCLGQERCVSDVCAMNDIEIWSLRYASLLARARQLPELVPMLHAAMAEQLARERHWRMALATMPADARLADFLCLWARTLTQRDLRDDHIAVHLTRSEVANYLGMSLETASRSFSRLAQLGLVIFESAGRRHFAIPDLVALDNFICRRRHACASALPGR